MFLTLLVVLFACARSHDLVEPKFQVLTPDELMVEVPHYEDRTFVTFRIGIRRAGQDKDELEFGENDVNNNRVFIYDQRLNLKKGDVVNYLLAFKDKRGYQAQSGNYYFNGVYYKKPFGRRHRFRRAETTTEITTETQEKLRENTDDAEEIEPSIESRFGGYGHNHHGPHNRRNWNNPHQPWGPPRQPPNFGHHPNFDSDGQPPPFGHRPNFGSDCNDHRHDKCHGRDNERWSDTMPPFMGGHNIDYHCRICNGGKLPGVVTTLRTTTTEEDNPDIDIRFQD